MLLKGGHCHPTKHLHILKKREKHLCAFSRYTFVLSCNVLIGTNYLALATMALKA